ncbi:cytochrome P450 2J4-like [Amphiura filiformis]|uniref:cytochrome P450 2J4-like n=1 Tax=Amphiura filiformis TaxID=82378 RepID=UPI003B20F33F
MSYLLALFSSYFDVQIVLTFLTVFLLSSYGLKHRQRLPPGPWSLPVVGNFLGLVFKIFSTGDEPEYQLAKLARRHGEVFTLRVGSKVIVIANGYKAIKEAFQNPLIADRPESLLLQETSLQEGVVFASGKSWKYQRSFMLNTFRNFGVGRSRFEGNIQVEAQTLVSVLDENNGKPYNPRVIIGNCVSNVISAVVFGKRYHHSDPEFQNFMYLVNSVATKMGSGGAVLFFPILRYIFPKLFGEVVSGLQEFTNFVDKKVKEHQAIIDDSSVNDFINVFLKEIKTTRNEKSDRGAFLHIKSLSATSVILFAAGIETSATTLRWALLYMMAHPEIQSKIQQEIDTVVGRNRMPQWSDRLQLPYTEAVLLEIQRIRTVTPLGVPHVASRDTKLGEYDIPAGAIVFSNVWAVHNDPDVWLEPDQFKPERFLDDQGKLRQREELIPFSIGQRVCPGENLAKMEMFLFFTYILHSFTIKKPSGEKCSLKGIGGITFGPTDYDIIVETRE